MKHLILATAGHVDHGKSALIRALTGTDPDRLPEEKARGITIDLGFASLALPSTNSTESIQLGIIDVPGHEDFVKNMVAGVGSVDLALLVVAADDLWMPQTEEHLQILTYLGVQHAVVALTKADLLEYTTVAIDAVRGRLQNSPFAAAPIVPTSIRDQQSLAILRRVMASLCDAIPSPLDYEKPRLAVDRVFTLRGIGTVVTGTLSGGTLNRGQAVTVQPSGLTARIRSVQSHGHDLPLASPGMRVALNLPDLPVAHRREDNGVRRGDVITLPSLAAASTHLDVQLTRCARTALEELYRIPTLRAGSMVRIHHGSATFNAHIRLLGVDELAPGASAIARLQCDTPVFAFVGDRFVVRDSSARHTLAGGIVLDASPRQDITRSLPQRVFLQTRAESGLDPATLLRTQLQRDGVCHLSSLLEQSRLSKSEVFEIARSLANSGELILRNDVAANVSRWAELLRRVADAIDAEHEAHPNRSGLDLSQLRTVIPDRAPDVFDALVATLFEDGFTRVGTQIKRASHRPVLPPQLQSAGERIRAALQAKPLEPPPRKELGTDAAALQAIRFLREVGEVVEISDDLVMSIAGFQQAQIRVADHIRTHGAATTSELRQALGTNRRVIVPLLERLDRDGVTLRLGDKRVLRRST